MKLMAGRRILEKKLKQIQDFETDSTSLSSSLVTLAEICEENPFNNLTELKRNIKKNVEKERVKIMKHYLQSLTPLKEELVGMKAELETVEVETSGLVHRFKLTNSKTREFLIQVEELRKQQRQIELRMREEEHEHLKHQLTPHEKQVVLGMTFDSEFFTGLEKLKALKENAQQLMQDSVETSNIKLYEELSAMYNEVVSNMFTKLSTEKSKLAVNLAQLQIHSDQYSSLVKVFQFLIQLPTYNDITSEVYLSTRTKAFGNKLTTLQQRSSEMYFQTAKEESYSLQPFSVSSGMLGSYHYFVAYLDSLFGLVVSEDEMLRIFYGGTDFQSFGIAGVEFASEARPSNQIQSALSVQQTCDVLDTIAKKHAETMYAHLRSLQGMLRSSVETFKAAYYAEYTASRIKAQIFRLATAPAQALYVCELLDSKLKSELMEAFLTLQTAENDRFFKPDPEFMRKKPQLKINEKVSSRALELSTLLDECRDLNAAVEEGDRLQVIPTQADKINMDLVLTKYISPVLKYVEQVSRRFDAKISSAVFHINNLVFLQQTLKKYPACSLFVESFVNEIGRFSEFLANTKVKETIAMVQKSKGVADGMVTVETLKQWNELVKKLTMDEIKHIENHRVKQSIKNSVTSSLCSSYSTLYESVKAHQDLSTAVETVYSPDDMKKLLENI